MPWLSRYRANGLLFGRSELLRSLRHSLWAQSKGHHTIDRLERRGNKHLHFVTVPFLLPFLHVAFLLLVLCHPLYSLYILTLYLCVCLVYAYNVTSVWIKNDLILFIIAGSFRCSLQEAAPLPLPPPPPPPTPPSQETNKYSSVSMYDYEESQLKVFLFVCILIHIYDFISPASTAFPAESFSLFFD